MVKIIEVVTHKDGATSETSKEFRDRKSMLKALKKSAMSTKLVYELTKYNEAIIDYDNARVHIKVVEEPDTKPLLFDSNGGPLTRGDPA